MVVFFDVLKRYWWRCHYYSPLCTFPHFVCVCVFFGYQGIFHAVRLKNDDCDGAKRKRFVPGEMCNRKMKTHEVVDSRYFIQSEWMKTNRTEANGIFNVFLSQTKIVRSTLRIAIDTLISLFSQWSLTSNEAIKIWTKLANKRHTCQSICLQTKSRTFLACKICISVVYLWIV